MAKIVQIYKKDKWNMLTVEVQGKTIILREISDQWGEESFSFLSRAEMMEWVARRFPKSDFAGRENEWEQLMDSFRQI
ncbi:hypothetical protein [Ferviditalea candida]|uniref:Uncharacterized protein n=1 Tax=Ferviditalea candida TaxID=3108399 RepID=A0ABU5ZGP1_9BACL|nr:hypothetical protein [Paenibacillaceae bacterium T2]